MSDWPLLFLGIIAAATLIMALIQVGAILVALRMAKEARQALGAAQQAMAVAQQTIVSVHGEVRPLLARAVAVADEASKSATIATAQAEKIDRLVTTLARRVDDTSAIVQEAVVAPAREGIAILAALKAAFSVLGSAADPRRRTSRSEEEDPLFIG